MMSALLPLLLLLLLCHQGMGAKKDGCKNLPDIVMCEDLHLNELPDISSSTTSVFLKNVTFNYLARWPVLSKDFLRKYARSSVQELVIENCQIHDIERGAFEDMADSLKKLEVFTNKVSAGAFSGLSLSKLLISNVHSGAFDQYAFEGLQRVSSLTIQKSNLVDLRSLYDDLLRLSERTFSLIDLTENHLSNIPQQFEKIFAKTSALALRENPWNCVCDLAWLINRYNMLSNGDDKTFCQAPVKLKGVNFNSLVANASTLAPRQRSQSQKLLILCPPITLQVQ
ncbi:Adhesion molecule with Ig-like domain 3 [Cichlidogyrus casuarinus]|uniref:Adhesion molecule with Ig-like domain 3 n=1 Tax=Cichlidogyrus casuarinus TaxID=1844966 RepID=A0ABD2PZD9_9PLAT